MTNVEDSNIIAHFLNEGVISSVGITDATIITAMLDAHRHATLAVAEQLRVANLIALASLAGRENIQEELAEAAHQALGRLIEYKLIGLDDEVVTISPDIANTIGIEG